ncbi:MAG: winged helix-turn-helix domain-containing protein [Thermoanaerobaculia bacterium]
MKAASPDSGRLLRDRIRLAIVTELAAGGARTFRELRDEVGATDGNLSVHARRLEEAGYVASRKSFSGRVPRTKYRLTPAGRRALARCLRELEALIGKARGLSASPPVRLKKPRATPTGRDVRGTRSPSRGR